VEINIYGVNLWRKKKPYFLFLRA